jgi:uncharacterized membrane protein
MRATYANDRSTRFAAGLLLSVAAAPLVYRAVTGRWPEVRRTSTPSDDVRRALAGERGVTVRDSVRIERPIGEVFRFWRTLSNLPLFMLSLDHVAERENGHSHWVARGPGGLRIEWDAEIFNEIENRLIAWRTLPGSDIAMAGSLNLAEVRGGRSTQVTLNLQYAAPGGRAADRLAMLVGRAPSQTLREDLRRLKQLLEAGELARVQSQETVS